jgi:hypothetical protein
MKTIEKYQQNQTHKTYYRDFLCVEESIECRGRIKVSNEKNYKRYMINMIRCIKVQNRKSVLLMKQK